MSDLLLFSFWTKARGDCLHYWVNLKSFMDSPQSPPALKSTKLKTDQHSILPHFISSYFVQFFALFSFTLHSSTSVAPFFDSLTNPLQLHHFHVSCCTTFISTLSILKNISFSIFHFLTFWCHFYLWLLTLDILYHTKLQLFLEFWLEFVTGLLLRGLMDPTWLEFDVGQILVWEPPEIGAPGTPGVSHGTKFFGPKILSYHPQMMLFYEFCWYIIPKMLKNGKNRPISTILAITVRNCKIVQLLPFFQYFLNNISTKLI